MADGIEHECKPDRIPCLVVGCRCTARADRVSHEWICGKHWRLVPRPKLMALSLIARRYRKTFGDNGYWQFPPVSEKRIAAVRTHGEWLDLWNEVKTIAQESAVGLL